MATTNAMQRFTGSVADIGPVNVRPLLRLVESVPFALWPQQTRAEIRPAMVTDLAWHGFGQAMAPVVEQCQPAGTTSYQHMLSAVMPGHSIEPHTDQQAPYWLARVHVPLATNADSVFIVDGIDHYMEVGHAYLVNTLRRHAVYNAGDTARVHFMFDIRAP